MIQNPVSTPTRKSGFVVVAGRPNVGKSTLLNQVLGTELSIVTPKAQTTRDRVLGILTEPEGQMIFLDTPGIHRAREGGINAYMMGEVREALESPSVVWYLVDPRSKVMHEELVLKTLVESGVAKQNIPVVLILNKIDIVNKDPYLKQNSDELLAKLPLKAEEIGIRFSSVVQLSAKKGVGVKDLLADAWTRLQVGEFYYPDDEDAISDRPVRFFVAEKIREQLLLCLGDELPYSCAVEIESYDEKVTPPRIEAMIYVERDSQKGMVIGKGGAKLKEIGSEARKSIEAFVGHQVFLGLRVKVLKDWSKDAEVLKRLGYNLPKASHTKAKRKRLAGQQGAQKKPGSLS